MEHAVTIGDLVKVGGVAFIAVGLIGMLIVALAIYAKGWNH